SLLPAVRQAPISPPASIDRPTHTYRPPQRPDRGTTYGRAAPGLPGEPFLQSGQVIYGALSRLYWGSLPARTNWVFPRFLRPLVRCCEGLILLGLRVVRAPV